MIVERNICEECRGIKFLCGLKYCPIYGNISPIPKLVKEMDGITPPDIFVGRFNYPKVHVGAILTKNEISGDLYPLPLEKILERTSSMYRVGNVQRVDRESKIVDNIREISLSEIKLKLSANVESIENKIYMDKISTPLGPRVIARSIEIEENPKIPKRIEIITEDFDMNAQDALWELYSNGFGNDYLKRLLSAGVLGRKIDRKLVPTRWAITAVDDIVGKKLIERVREYESVDTIIYAEKSYMDNHFFIFLIPGTWMFEMVENWHGFNGKIRNIMESGDYEGYYGRKTYASNVTGAYYAARLAVLEYLESIKRSASVIIYRVVGPNYRIPLGVWLIRETVRDALRNVSYLGIKNLKDVDVQDYIKNVILSTRVYRFLEKQKRIEAYG